MSSLNNTRKIPLKKTKFRIKFYNFREKRNFGLLEIDSNVSGVSTETSVE
jgi:hypothetical protein